MKNNLIGYTVTEDCQLDSTNFEAGEKIIIADHSEDLYWKGTDWYDSYPQIFEPITTPEPQAEDIKGGLPEPLTVYENLTKGLIEINVDAWDYEGTDVAIMTTNRPLKGQKELAAEICTRYNSHTRLVEALRELVYVTGYTYAGKPSLLKAQAVLDSIK